MANSVALGTYIGSGTDKAGAEVSYTLRLMEKKLAWLDYKAEKPPLDKISWHSEGAFVIVPSENDKQVVKFTIGGLPGQPRVGEVFEFVAEPSIGGKSHVLVSSASGVFLQPQADTLHDGSKVCAACGLKIEKQMIKVGDLVFHKECFVCNTCRSPLTGQFSKQEDGTRLCMTCIPKKFCEACKKEIKGTATSVGGKVYHPECFVCEECQQSLSGGFFNKGGKRLCKVCLDAAAPKARAKAKSAAEATAPAPDTAKPKAAAAAPKAVAAPKDAETPKAKPTPEVAPEPVVAKPKVTLGCYGGKGPGDPGAEVAYAVRIMDDFSCWLDCNITTKISTSSWHAEGTFVEQLDPWCIRFTVDRCPYGGGPSKGSVYELGVEADGSQQVLVCEGVRCLFLENVADVAPSEYMAAVDPAIKQPAAPVAKPAVTARSEKLPGEGAATRLAQGSAGIMERTAVDTSNNIVKGEAANALASKGQAAIAPASKSQAATAPASKGEAATAPASKSEAATAPAAKGEAATAPASKSEDTKAASPAVDGCLTLEELKNADVWKARGVDAAKREEYLSDSDFMATFGMNKADFAKMPKWKRDGRKRENGLF